ncbi:MAG: putative metalloprotease [Acidobacteria bacterium]|nr:putative metalloprotease [Acidobacteriota bacterium]
MKWTPGGTSRNIEDRRGTMVRRAAPIGLGGLLLLLLLTFLTGQDFLSLVPEQAMVPSQAPAGPVRSTPEEEQAVQFVSFVLDDLQETWTRLLPGRYQEAKLVLFRDLVQSACGFAQSATGPFYCPADQRVYLDLGFFEELRRRFGAPGDFAQAYVIAHEVGHHVQRLLGIEQQVRQMQQARPRLANQLSVRMELQADCLAGVWGHSTARRDILEREDVEEGLNAAAAIGDDRIQKMSGSFVRPDAFTHGSSAQRVEWFRRGLESGNPDVCDTFSGTD